MTEGTWNPMSQQYERPTLTLADFVLARIAEDEAAATLVTSAPPNWTMTTWPHDGEPIPVPAAAQTFHPSRVLAECEAKRRIIEWAVARHDRRQRIASGYGDYSLAEPEPLRLLALPYADHPDYRNEWRP